MAGVPEAGGLGNVRLDITVVEKATGYEQTTTELITVADSPVNSAAHPGEHRLQAHAAVQLPGGHRDPRRRAGGGRGHRERLLLRRGLQRGGQAGHQDGGDQAGDRPGAVHAAEEGRAHDGRGHLRRRVRLQRGGRVVLAVGQLHPRAAAGATSTWPWATRRASTWRPPPRPAPSTTRWSRAAGWSSPAAPPTTSPSR